eukprot:SAG25_NODE_2585_length_1514_cov_1.236749_2_plen_68_part_00
MFVYSQKQSILRVPAPPIAVDVRHQQRARLLLEQRAVADHARRPVEGVKNLEEETDEEFNKCWSKLA